MTNMTPAPRIHDMHHQFSGRFHSFHVLKKLDRASIQINEGSLAFSGK